MQLCSLKQITHWVLRYCKSHAATCKLMCISMTMYLQEDELAALQKSLQALCGPAPAQLSKQLQAAPGRRALPEQPPDTCLSGGAAIARNRQQDEDIECQPAQDSVGRPTAQAPCMAAPAKLQQPRPTMSLLNSSGAADSHDRGRQRRMSLSRVTQPRPTGVRSSNEPPKTIALGAIRESGASHSRLQQTSWPRPVFSNSSVVQIEHQSAKGQEALTDTLKNPTSPVWTESSAQAGVHKPPEHLRQSRMQEPARTAGRLAGRADAICVSRPSAPAASRQQVTLSRQPSEPDHPAIPPLLEPAPYIVEEPDSPTQEPADRTWGAAAEQQKAMPSCLITETTITRSAMEGLHGSLQFQQPACILAGLTHTVLDTAQGDSLIQEHAYIWRWPPLKPVKQLLETQILLHAGQSPQAEPPCNRSPHGPSGRCPRLESSTNAKNILQVLHRYH